MMDLALKTISLLALFVFSALFSASETALFSLSKIQRRRLSEKSPRLAKWVSYHLEHPRRALISILIGNLLINTIATSIVTLIVLRYFGVRYLSPAMVGYTILLILAAEIIPKTIAVRKNETVALYSALPLQFFAILIYPIRRIVRRITDWMLDFVIHDKREHHDEISEEELKTLLKIGEEEGILDRQEHYMLQKIFDLGERPVKDIMTPRIDLAALNIEDSREGQLQMIQKFHFTHFPVYQNSLDNILGVLSVQEFALNPDIPIQNFLKQLLFVPELKRIDDLLAEFRVKNQSFALCVDEYGGTAGVVTLEDILEEIFGEFYDEYAKVEHPIRPLGHGEYIVEAKTSLADFNEHFSSHLESEDASTIGGFILEKMGRVPEKGERLDLPNFEIRVHDVIRQRRIRSVIVKLRS
jgi:CBS domain containing-hemolysin-like protein